jgi:hypothetical protein
MYPVVLSIAASNQIFKSNKHSLIFIIHLKQKYVNFIFTRYVRAGEFDLL